MFVLTAETAIRQPYCAAPSTESSTPAETSIVHIINVSGACVTVHQIGSHGTTRVVYMMTVQWDFGHDFSRQDRMGVENGRPGFEFWTSATGGCDCYSEYLIGLTFGEVERSLDAPQ
jgi:hypothetical protein